MLDGTSKRELDEPTQEAERVEKLPLATAFNMDEPKEETQRGGIPERKFDKLKQDAENLEKPPFAITFYREKPKGEWERDVDVEGTTKECSSDMLHYITRDASDNRNLINVIAGTPRADTARITASDEEIQGQTRQHSRPNTPLVRGEHEEI